LAAHGVGAGSLVYLRRVFEALIKETIDLASVEPTWDQAAFDQLRYLDKKIEFLKDRLPGFLVENKHFYGLMSAGIHNLSEQECLHLFPIALDGICAILDQKVDVQKSREREESAKANINALAHLIKA